VTPKGQTRDPNRPTERTVSKPAGDLLYTFIHHEGSTMYIQSKTDSKLYNYRQTRRT